MKLTPVDMDVETAEVAERGLELACVLDEDCDVCIRCEARLIDEEPHRDDCEIGAVLRAAGYGK